jgi:hypothetical protein
MSPQEYRALVDRLESIQPSQIEESTESLEEIDRRGFLKGAGAAAGLAALGAAGIKDAQAQSLPNDVDAIVRCMTNLAVLKVQFPDGHRDQIEIDRHLQRVKKNVQRQMELKNISADTVNRASSIYRRDLIKMEGDFTAGKTGQARTEAFRKYVDFLIGNAESCLSKGATGIFENKLCESTVKTSGDFRRLLDRIDGKQTLTESQLDEINWKKAAAGVAATAALAGGMGASASDAQAQSSNSQQTVQKSATFNDVQSQFKGAERITGAAERVFQEVLHDNSLQKPSGFGQARGENMKQFSNISSMRGGSGLIQSSMDMSELWKNMSNAERQRTLNALVAYYSK